MTAKEKNLIKRAIHLIHHEDDYNAGMDILSKLVGIEPMDLSGLKNVDLKDIRTGPTTVFKGGDVNSVIDEFIGQMMGQPIDEEERPTVGFDYKNKQQ